MNNQTGRPGFSLIEAMLSCAVLMLFMTAFTAFLLAAKNEVLRQDKYIDKLFKLRTEAACKKGFTLIELIISISIMILIVSTSIIFTIYSVKLSRKIIKKSEKNQVLVLVSERMSLDINSADAILPASSTKELFLKIASGEVAYAYVSGKVRRRINGQTAYLTNEKEINSLGIAYPGNNLIGISIEGKGFICAIK
ncbi:MAG: prepilin-type N-terminal cleavage/methylation domain-containing protein [Candidatus Margulisiibacteriota bacterium]